MALTVALYSLAIVVGIIFGGAIIEISENNHVQDKQEDVSEISMTSDLKSNYYPSKDNIIIKVGDSQTFSIYPNIFVTYTLDGKKIYEGQTYTMYASKQNIGKHILEVSNVIDKKTWYISVVD